jgi:hypothetical protein
VQTLTYICHRYRSTCDRPGVVSLGQTFFFVKCFICLLLVFVCFVLVSPLFHRMRNSLLIFRDNYKNTTLQMYFRKPCLVWLVKTTANVINSQHLHFTSFIILCPYLVRSSVVNTSEFYPKVFISVYIYMYIYSVQIYPRINV